MSPVELADEIFSDLLPRIEDLPELKLLLYVVHLAERRKTRGVTLADLLTPDVVRSVVGLFSPEPAERRLSGSIDRAVANGILLRVRVRHNRDVVVYYLPATRENRQMVDRIRLNDPGMSREPVLGTADEIAVYRPNVFSLYEQQIGPLTPLLAEQLRDAERSYPRWWIEEAIRMAVDYNKRNWRYVQSILTRWEETGGPDGVSRRSS